MLRSLPVDEPGQLVLFGMRQMVGSTDSLPNGSAQLFSYPFYRSFSQKNEVFSGVTAISSVEFSTHGTLAGQRHETTARVAGFRHLFFFAGRESRSGTHADRGRRQAPGSGAVAVASYSWWQRHGNDPAMVGKISAHRGHRLHNRRHRSARILRYHCGRIARFLDSPFHGKGDFARLERPRRQVVPIALSGGAAQAWCNRQPRHRPIQTCSSSSTSAVSTSANRPP